MLQTLFKSKQLKDLMLHFYHIMPQLITEERIDEFLKMAA